MLLKEAYDKEQITLTNEETKVQTPLPGIIQRLSVGGEVLIDNASTPNGNSKIPKNYKEKNISIELLLLDTKLKTAYEYLEDMEKLFKEKSSDSTQKSPTPATYVITNTHINKRGINKVIFSSYNSSESNAKDYIMLTVSFEEVLYPSYQVEQTK